MLDIEDDIKKLLEIAANLQNSEITRNLAYGKIEEFLTDIRKDKLQFNSSKVVIEEKIKFIIDLLNKLVNQNENMDKLNPANFYENLININKYLDDYGENINTVISQNNKIIQQNDLILKNQKSLLELQNGENEK